MFMDYSIWTSEKVLSAVLQGNINLEIILANYFKGVVERVGSYEMDIQQIKTVEELDQRILTGIEQLDPLRKEIISVVSVFAGSRDDLLKKFLPSFFEQLLRMYEKKDINLYSGNNLDALRNDHYRFFNQFLFISLASVLVDAECFEVLAELLHRRFNLYLKHYGQVRQVNFVRFRSYNYTLNEHLNTVSPKRVSVFADYVFKYAASDYEKLIKADILLYYISLKYHTDDLLDDEWFPELSVYNRDREILPFMVSKAYFNKAKVLFGVETVEQYKQYIKEVSPKVNPIAMFRIPSIESGLMYDTVGSME